MWNLEFKLFRQQLNFFNKSARGMVFGIPDKGKPGGFPHHQKIP